MSRKMFFFLTRKNFFNRCQSNVRKKIMIKFANKLTFELSEVVLMLTSSPPETFRILNRHDPFWYCYCVQSFIYLNLCTILSTRWLRYIYVVGCKRVHQNFRFIFLTCTKWNMLVRHWQYCDDRSTYTFAVYLYVVY